jgi:hypothetical protein
MHSDFSDGYQHSSLKLSESESKRFGQCIGRGSFSSLDENDFDQLVQQLLKFDLVFLRIPAHLVRKVQAFSSCGLDVFQSDNLLYFANKTPKGTHHKDWYSDKLPPLSIIQEHVAECFDGYLNHYTADCYLSERKSLDGYLEWSSNLYLADNVESVYMPFRDKIGALALAVVEGSTTEIILNSVLPELQGRGLYIQLLEMVEYRTLEIGGSMVRISTQSTNIRVINALIKAGYRLENSFLTLHIRPMTKLAK